MKKSIKLTMVMLLAVTLVLSACGKKNETSNNGAAGGNGATSNFKVGMVTDVGGVNDKSFNQSAWEGLQSIKASDGVKVEYLQSTKADDYVTNLNKFVKGGYNLTWGIGMSLEKDIKTVADQNKDANLAIIDAVVDAPNVKSVTFSENEGSFLVGVVAGLTTKTNKVGFIGGMQLPVIERFAAGFQAGVKAVNPDAQVMINYTGAFDKPDLGKTQAATYYNDGADILFPAAGATGTGVFNEGIARKKAGADIWVIGVDKDQSIEFGDEITLTSMIKRVDEAVIRVSKQVMDGTFTGGTETLGLKENGVGIADTSSKNVSAEILKTVEDYKAKIISGEIVVPEVPTK